MDLLCEICGSFALMCKMWLTVLNYLFPACHYIATTNLKEDSAEEEIREVSFCCWTEINQDFNVSEYTQKYEYLLIVRMISYYTVYISNRQRHMLRVTFRIQMEQKHR